MKNRLLQCASAAALIVAYHLAHYGSCMLMFFTWDDMWLLQDAAAVQLRSVADIPQLFQFNHNGFLLYRPLTATAFFYLLRQLFALDASAYHAFHLGFHILNACLVFGFQAEGHEITTVEGLGGKLTPLQATFVATGAVQCGYCTPGMIMSAEGLLRANASPDTDDIRHALAGNMCRCTGFESIVRAIAAEAIRRRDSRD